MAMSYASSRTQQQSAPEVQQETDTAQLQPWGNAAMGEEIAGPGECAPEPEQWGQAPEGGETWWASEEEGEMGICAEGGTVMEQLEAELQSPRPKASRVRELCLRLDGSDLAKLIHSSLWDQIVAVLPPEEMQWIVERAAVFDRMVQSDPNVFYAIVHLQEAIGPKIQEAVAKVLWECGGAPSNSTVPLSAQAQEETRLSGEIAHELGGSWLITVLLEQFGFNLTLTPTSDGSGLLVQASGEATAAVQGDVSPEWRVGWVIDTFYATFDPVLGFHLSGMPGAPVWKNEKWM